MMSSGTLHPTSKGHFLLLLYFVVLFTFLFFMEDHLDRPASRPSFLPLAEGELKPSTCWFFRSEKGRQVAYYYGVVSIDLQLIVRQRAHSQF
jgi:uncharacterized membrane protein